MTETDNNKPTRWKKDEALSVGKTSNSEGMRMMILRQERIWPGGGVEDREVIFNESKKGGWEVFVRGNGGQYTKMSVAEFEKTMKDHV